MSDTFRLSPCCRDENYGVELGTASGPVLWICRNCGWTFEDHECIVQNVEYCIDDYEDTAYYEALISSGN